MRLVWSDLALLQLREAREFVAGDNPDAAGRLVESIREATRRLTEFPLIGTAFGDQRSFFVVPRTPFRILYRVGEDELRILAVWHGARRWPFDTR